MAERGKEDGMKEEKDGETRRRGDTDGSVFNQAVMEQRGAGDSEDIEASQVVLEGRKLVLYP